MRGDRSLIPAAVNEILRFGFGGGAGLPRYAVRDFELRGKAIRKVSLLARWSTKDVWAYAKAHAIPLLPLYELGYTSVGCEPCTTLPADPLNPRSGRWQGQKLECGIHLQNR